MRFIFFELIKPVMENLSRDIFFFLKLQMSFFSGGGKEGGGRNEEGGEGKTVTHVTTFRAVRWRML